MIIKILNIYWFFVEIRKNFLIIKKFEFEWDYLECVIGYYINILRINNKIDRGNSFIWLNFICICGKF